MKEIIEFLHPPPSSQLGAPGSKYVIGTSRKIELCHHRPRQALIIFPHPANLPDLPNAGHAVVLDALRLRLENTYDMQVVHFGRMVHR